MTEPANPDLPLETSRPPLLEPGDYAQYLLHAKSEILYVLKSLLDHVSQITVFFHEGQDLLLTTLVAVGNESILLDLGADVETNRKALAVDKLFCVTSLEKVRIQFLLRGLTPTSHGGRPAFRADLPDDLLRLQRREFFRLTTPVTRPLKCRIPITEPDRHNNFIIDLNVVDISGGGLAIALTEGVDVAVNKEFANCRIELPEVGLLTTTLRVRNQFEITLRSGSRVRRAGCEFVKLPGPMTTLVHRYIIKVERERKARTSGMR